MEQNEIRHENIKLSETFLKKYKTKTPPFGYNGLGYVIFKRTYARYLEDQNRTEEWWETVKRCVEGAQNIGAGYTKEEMEKLYDYVFNLKCNFAGRMLWQLGTRKVERYSGASLLNCWGISMNDPEDFCFLFDNLMLGGGVGFSVRREDIHELPRIKEGVEIKHLSTNDSDFIVPDSREGWVSLLRIICDSFFRTGKSFTYSTILVRGAGERIKGFGGVSSGPTILVNGLDKIFKIFKDREGKKLRSVDILDINDILGSIVVSGNVRRSALLAIGDTDDYLYMRAKRWDVGNVPNWRAMSNNSIYADSYDQILPMFWEGYTGNGEPYGLINIKLSQRYGRLKDGLMKNSSLYPTDSDNCEVFNPCSEISLGDGEACNLSELYLNNINSKEEFIECASLLYKVQKATWNLNFDYSKTKKIVVKNRRIGIGITGICQSLDKLEWLDSCYKELRKLDKRWSKEKGVSESIKLTTCKPSGTLSLLSGSTPGVHPAYAQYYIRRIRIASNDPLIKICKDAGLKAEYVKNFDGTDNRNTVVVEFPCESGKNAILAKNMKATEQLELVKKIQSDWSDNSVSVTVYFKKEELPEIQEWLKNNYENSLKSVSFLLHSEHGFSQAPYEEINEERYKELLDKIDLKKLSLINGNKVLEDVSCENGTCPVR